MIKNKQDLIERIVDLEAEIQETDELMKEAFEASVFMVEPIKTQFVNELNLATLELNKRKNDLKYFKEMAGV